jgi:glycerol kinase
MRLWGRRHVLSCPVLDTIALCPLACLSASVAWRLGGVPGYCLDGQVYTAGAAADLGAPLTSLRVDGGLTRSRLLIQAQADLLRLPVLVCRSPHATALGAAALARLGTGDAVTAGDAVRGAEVEAIVEPSVSADEAAERMVASRSALGKTLR